MPSGRLPGSESGACGQGSPRNLGGLVVSTGDAAGAAAISSPGPLALPERAESEQGRGVPPSEGRRSAAGRAARSRSPPEVGEQADRPRTDGLATVPAAVSPKQSGESSETCLRPSVDAMVEEPDNHGRICPGEGKHPRPPGPSRSAPTVGFVDTPLREISLKPLRKQKAVRAGGTTASPAPGRRW